MYKRTFIVAGIHKQSTPTQQTHEIDGTLADDELVDLGSAVLAELYGRFGDTDHDHIRRGVNLAANAYDELVEAMREREVMG